MDLTKKFQSLVEDDNADAIGFFTALSDKEQASLKPLFNTFSDNGYGYRVGGKDWRINGRFDAIAKVKICALYLYNFNTYRKLFNHIADDYFHSKYYRQFRPTWLSRYLSSDISHDVAYSEMADLVSLGCQIEPSILVAKLIDSIWDYNLDKGEYDYQTAHLDDYPITLNEHFWLIFYEPSDIHIVDKYHRVNWTTTIADLTQSQRIDRQRVLRECLLTDSRQFNQLAVGWFFDLFISLKPTEAELKSLFPELMLVLNGTHSKAINVVLKYCKTLYSETDFPVDEWLAAAEVLMTSEVKAVINNTFIIFDKLVKIAPERSNELCELSVNALLHRDEKIQTRVAKFLQKHGAPDNTDLCCLIEAYYDELFSTVKTLLQPFTSDFQTSTNTVEDVNATPIATLRADNLINVPDTFDEKIFFITQAFENNEPYHFDLYLVVLPNLIKQIAADNVERLEPAIKAALRTLTANNNRIGYIELLLSIQFLNIVSELLKQHHNKKVSKVYDAIRQIDSIPWRVGGQVTDQLEDLQFNFASLDIFRELLIFSQSLILQEEDLPILSTPTHSPCYIDLSVLCQRLQRYQANDISVNSIDFQIAVSRVVLDAPPTENIPLTDELAELIDCLISEKAIDFKQCKNIALWLAVIYRSYDEETLRAFITHFNLPLQYLYTPAIWFIDKDDYQWKWLKLDYLQIAEQPAKIMIFLDYFYLDYLKNKRIAYSTSYFTAQEHDKLLSLSPFKPDKIQAEICRLIAGGGYPDPDIARSYHGTMVLLQETWQSDFSEISYLHLAYVALDASKANAQLAAELWLQTVNENRMDSIQLGKVLGKLEHDEYAPLKRLTDLIATQLMNVSTLHDHALVDLMTAMITNMHEQPIKGVKKLLELYLELLTITQIDTPDTLIDKLQIWGQVKSLKAVVNKITIR